MLDRWGARDRMYRETVRHLMDEHGVEGWWAQAITYGYERSRGMRRKHQQADGFTVDASRTIAVPIEVAFDGFVNSRRRKGWLTAGTMSPRTSSPATRHASIGRTARRA
jgi:hypothetical protein